ncbi:MAG TPA: hypothetical protein VGG96_09925 [Steroidobacteraceae bacterium]
MSSGRFTTIGIGVLRTTTQRNASDADGLIFMKQSSGHVDEVAGCRAGWVFRLRPQRMTQTPFSTYAIVCCSP